MTSHVEMRRCDLALSVGLHCVLFQNASECAVCVIGPASRDSRHVPLLRFYREHRSSLLSGVGSLGKDELDVSVLPTAPRTLPACVRQSVAPAAFCGACNRYVFARTVIE
jgi:hypothetical protein